MGSAEEVHIQQWVRSGEMLYNTAGLDISHELHPYNQALAQGVIPEEFGIEHPYTEEYGNKSRGELISEIVDLKKQLETCLRYC